MAPSIPQLLIVLVIVLLIFGAGKLPQIGDALGRSIKNFKRSSSGGDELEVGEKQELEKTQEAEVVSEKQDK